MKFLLDDDASVEDLGDQSNIAFEDEVDEREKDSGTEQEDKGASEEEEFYLGKNDKVSKEATFGVS